MALFTYSLKEIEAGVHIREPLPWRWLAENLDEAASVPAIDGLVEASLSLTGRDVLVRGTVQARVELPCARCLDPASVEIVGDLTLLLVPEAPPKVPVRAGSRVRSSKDGSSKDGSDELGVALAKKARKHKDVGDKRGRAGSLDGEDEGRVISSDDAELDTYSGEEVVLDGFIREAILLELPMFPLCSDTCTGIGLGENVSSGFGEQTSTINTGNASNANNVINPQFAPLMELMVKSRE